MSPTPASAALLALIALLALVVPPPLVGLAALVVVTAAVVDALAVRRVPSVARTAPPIVARGVEAPFRLVLEPGPGRSARVRQPLPPELRLSPQEAGGGLEARLVGLRRGRYALPVPAVRAVGPLGLGAWHHRAGATGELRVYPDLPGARRLAASVRRGRFRAEGRSRGPLGLGTEFESVREYLPDDDVRQVNWAASARLGRPMSNQYRVERDRDVICLLDCGRLMAAPLGEQTRLDVAVDAAVAVAAVADELGDRSGTIAFDAELRRSLASRRRGARALVEALFELEPEPVDSDYERAFREVAEAKRAFVLVLTDLLEEGAARPLVDALPVLLRRHVVAVASVSDRELERYVLTEPERPLDVYRAAVAVDVLDARARVVRTLAHAGVQVVEAPPEALPAACVRAYLRAKARARL